MLTEILFPLLIFCYCTFFLAQSKSDLKKECETLTYSFYADRSCFVASTSTVDYPTATASCAELTNVKGTRPHLAFMLSEKVANLINEKIFIPSGLDRFWVGLTQTEQTTDVNAKWSWLFGDGTYMPVPGEKKLTLWMTSDGSTQTGPNNEPGNLWQRCNTIMLWNSQLGMEDYFSNAHFPYICQHHEPISFGQATFRKLGDHIKGHNETNIVGGESTEIDIYDCTRKCRDQLVCLSFSFHAITGHCQLHWSDPNTVTSEYKPVLATGYNVYYGFD